MPPPLLYLLYNSTYIDTDGAAAAVPSLANWSERPSVSADESLAHAALPCASRPGCAPLGDEASLSESARWRVSAPGMIEPIASLSTSEALKACELPHSPRVALRETIGQHRGRIAKR